MKIGTTKFPFNYKPNTITRLTRPIIGYKHVYVYNSILDDLEDAICKVQIPKWAYVRWANYRWVPYGLHKLRASKAEVLSIRKISTRGNIKKAFSIHDSEFVYVVGKTVVPTEPFDKDSHKECASGIHFFLTPSEARTWAR